MLIRVPRPWATKLVAAAVVVQYLFNTGQIGRQVDVGHHHVNIPLGVGVELSRQSLQPVLVTCHQYQIVTLASQAIGVGGANTRRSAGDQRVTFGLNHCSCSRRAEEGGPCCNQDYGCNVVAAMSYIPPLET